MKDREAAASPTIRDGVWEWYLSTAYTRLSPGAGVLGLMTFWHEDDWAGRIQQVAENGTGDKFEVVKYPAINDQGDEYLLPDGTITYSLPPQMPPEGARMTRPQGTAIHPERYDTTMMRSIRENLISSGQKWVWDALYQQNPIPDEGTYFNKDIFHYYGTPPARTDLRVYQAWDFAITSNQTSDYTVGACVGQDAWDNLYVLDIRRFREDDGGALVEEVLDFAAMWKADMLGFEDGHIWKALEFQFRKRCGERQQYPAHELLKPLTDKLTRASPLKGRMQLGKVYFDRTAAWFTDCQKELLHFPAGKHDDIVDALAWVVRLTLTSAPPSRPTFGSRLKGWRERLLPGAMHSAGHMAA